jgi:hypothetical protein
MGWTAFLIRPEVIVLLNTLGVDDCSLESKKNKKKLWTRPRCVDAPFAKLFRA